MNWWAVLAAPFLMAFGYIVAAGMIGGMFSLAAMDLSIVRGALQVWTKPETNIVFFVRIVAIFLATSGTYASVKSEIGNADNV